MKDFLMINNTVTKSFISPYFFLISLISFSFLLTSCRKADRDSDVTTQMVSDNGFAFFVMNDLFRQVHSIALSDTALNTINSGFWADSLCIDTITHSTTNGFPDTVIVDFGLTNGTACADGNLRRGKLKIIFNGKYGATSKNFTVIPQHYYLNDYKVDGKMTISGRARNASNNLSFYVQMENGVATNDSLRFEMYASTSGIQREWIAGEASSAIDDDVFNISGTYGGKVSKGTAYKAEITSPLRRQFDCKWNVSGKEKIVPENLSPREVDYGSACDNAASVNINGKNFDITLLP